MSKPTINLDQFQQFDLKIGTVKAAKRLENSNKLLILTVDFGSEERTILAGIGKVTADVETLVGTQMPFIVNLEPKELAGEMSHGMVLAASGPEGPVLLRPSTPVEPGTEIR